MLYVDGMNGVINHSDTIQWLYSLTASRVGNGTVKHCSFDMLGPHKVEVYEHSAFFVLPQFRLVGKTALKLLLVFVEYTESNSRVLYDAIQTVDSNQGIK